MAGSCFDPRPRAGGDTDGCANTTIHVVFRSAPPRRGRPADPISCKRSMSCFDPRPRAGGDQGSPRRNRVAAVSIRAPAQGATVAFSSSKIQGYKFRSAPPRRGRQDVRRTNDICPATCRARLTASRGFDPRPPRRGRPRCDALCGLTHCLFRSAPPRRGRRRRHSRSGSPARSFDPRPRAGGDVSFCTRSGPATRLEPRPRAGGDRRPICASTRDRGFDPRPRAGGDPPPSRRHLAMSKVSIRALAKRATFVVSPFRRSQGQSFRSAPPRRGRPAAYGDMGETPCFDPRPRAGGDR